MRYLFIFFICSISLISVGQSGTGGGYVISGSGDSSCIISGTRAQLLALRASNSLDRGCSYLLTDHVQGRLGIGTTILLNAVSPNEFSENASINTTYDNEGWRGIYDIDRALVLELQDNRNNIARGFNGTEVTNFDWGNTFITNVCIDNATWNTTIGSIRTVTNVLIKNGGTLTTTGQTGGTIQRVVCDNGTINTSLSNISLINFNVNNATATLNNFTAGSTLTNWEIYNGATVNISGSTSGVTLSNVKIYSSTLNHINVTTGTITGVGLEMYNNSTINHNNGALNLSINRVFINNTATLNQTSGSITLQDCVLENRIILQLLNGTATQNFNVIGGAITNFSIVDLLGDVNINGTRLQINNNAKITVNNGALGTYTFTGTKIDNSSQFTALATSTAGNVSITLTELNTQSTIQKNGTGVITVASSKFDNQGRLLANGSRNINVNRSYVNNLGTITTNSTFAGVSDGVTYVSIFDRGNVSFTATGAVGNNILYSTVLGLNATVTFSGTTTQNTLQQSNISQSAVNFLSNISNTLSFANLSNSSTINIQNMTLSKSMQNFRVNNQSTININNPTGAGSINWLSADNQSTINVQGTATTSQMLVAINQATITQNGGQSVNIIKQMQGTLTTGNFNHQNLVMISPTSRTLTGANTNRSEYIGLISSVPLF